MCGRYALAVDTATLVNEFGIVADTSHLAESWHNYNVAPTTHMPIVVDTPEGRAIELARWGLVPTWAKDPSIGARMINARMETAAEKPAYRSSFAKRRCLIPASGYYEWYRPTDGGAKQPFFIHRGDEKSLAIAGLYSWWRASDHADWLLSFTLLTGAASGDLALIHDRVPMLISERNWESWLSATTTTGVAQLLEPTADGDVVATAVSTRVNNVRNNSPDLIEPIPGE
jgi:putative SOS response-associated peptidase YedK